MRHWINIEQVKGRGGEENWLLCPMLTQSLAVARTGEKDPYAGLLGDSLCRTYRGKIGKWPVGLLAEGLGELGRGLVLGGDLYPGL